MLHRRVEIEKQDFGKKKLKEPEPFLTLPLPFDNGISTYFLDVYSIVIERQINPKDSTGKPVYCYLFEKHVLAIHMIA
jgi:hypothetical protein